jgi:hypothetical protein
MYQILAISKFVRQFIYIYFFLLYIATIFQNIFYKYEISQWQIIPISLSINILIHDFESRMYNRSFCLKFRL